MIIQGDSSPFPFGYTSIVKMNDDKTRKAGMNFGILVLKKGEVMNGSGEKSGKKERVCVLLSGEACFSWRDQSVNVGRTSIWTQKPWCLHVPSGESMSIRALSDRAEVAVLTAFNDRVFEPHFYGGGEVKSEERGKGILNDTSERIVRTIFDYKSAPHSNLVIGETITFPGRWSSYPPHSHMQPEIYHYRFTPDNGFGLAAVGEKAYKVYNNDTLVITDNMTHPQAAAPGYAMYYLWAIRHLPQEPYLEPKDDPSHTWMLEKDAKIWPNR